MSLLDNEEDSLQKIAKHVYDWYTRWLEENVEPETDVMKTFDLAKTEGRFELLVLARLFNNPLKEETAIRYFRKLKEWFRNKGFSYRVDNKTVGRIDTKVVKDTSHKLHQEFRDLVFNEFVEMDSETRRKNYTGFVTCAVKFREKDLKNYINETTADRDILDVICEKLRMAGIFVKSFWVVREMYKARLWKIDRENHWMCCVPDSKVRRYLNDMEFVPRSIRIKKGQTQYYLFQLKAYSRIIWKYFNEPFDKSYFDLHIFRYLKEAQEISSEEFEKLKKVD